MTYFLIFLGAIIFIVTIIFSIPSIRKDAISSFKKAHDESYEKARKAVAGNEDSKN